MTVGYPENLLDNNEIEIFYQDLEINPGNFLSTSLNVSVQNFLKEANNRNPDDWIFRTNLITTPNAAYDLMLKTVGKRKFIW